MIILVTFLILVLVIISTRNNFKGEISTSPNFSETFFWQNNNKAYSLLLHSVSIYDSSFTAYSNKWDSLMKFSAIPDELQSIKKKLTIFPFKKQQCSSCHIN